MKCRFRYQDKCFRYQDKYFRYQDNYFRYQDNYFRYQDNYFRYQDKFQYGSVRAKNLDPCRLGWGSAYSFGEPAG